MDGVLRFGDRPGVGFGWTGGKGSAGAAPSEAWCQARCRGRWHRRRMNGEFRLGLGSGYDPRACGIDRGRLGGGSGKGVLCEGRRKHQKVCWNCKKCVGLVRMISAEFCTKNGVSQ